jgi:DNA-binding response OmpR family regulator
MSDLASGRVAQAAQTAFRILVVDDFLSKPVRREELIARLAVAARGGR